MLSCKDVTDKASDYLDGQLPLRTRFGIWLHLLICVRCRRYIEQMLITIRTVARLGSTPTPDEDQVEQLSKQLLSCHKEHQHEHRH